MKLYRVTPKRGKWVVQRVLDRKTFGKPFRLKADALTYKLKLDAKSGININPIDKLSVEDIDILLGNLKVFFKKLYKLKKTIKN